MRVFVTGTGRCGTATFAKACQLVHGFTAAHESLQGEALARAEYPDQHIEVDPHLTWVVPRIQRRYPDAKWVVLHRGDTKALLRSIATRATLAGWLRLALQKTVSPELGAGVFVEHVEEHLRAMLPGALHLHTPVDATQWVRFLEHIGGPAALVRNRCAEQILQTIHNASGCAQ